MYLSTKKYGHEIGLSCAFRQWRAQTSHCQFLHGYSLAFKFTFESENLDARNWVVDFGSLKGLKKKLEDLFDHKTVVASDDPHLVIFQEMATLGIIDLRILNAVGCEKFAEIAFYLAKETLEEEGFAPRCWVVKAEVSEHGANSAIFYP